MDSKGDSMSIYTDPSVDYEVPQEPKVSAIDEAHERGVKIFMTLMNWFQEDLAYALSERKDDGDEEAK